MSGPTRNARGETESEFRARIQERARKETAKHYVLPRTRNFKHFSTCKRCNGLIIHTGQIDHVTGQDWWHVTTERDGFSFHGHCKERDGSNVGSTVPTLPEKETS